MSSQAERIKAFKLAQHARLQKQDEEEQWISSEELCTEGSSDEETHTSSVKSSHRKQKRNPRTEKRGISPLAQPPRTTETESTSTYQRDSKYLLPDMYTSNVTTNTQITSGIDQPEILKVKAEASDLRVGTIDAKVEKLNLASSEAHSSKSRDTSQDSDESDEDMEVEKMIQWRPKRGSIKLPDFPEGEPDKPRSTLHHAIFEADAFYTEMVAKVNFLKQGSTRSIYTLLSDVATNNCKTGRADTSGLVVRRSPAVSNLFEKISVLDTEISERNSLFENAKKERMLVQEEMCNSINEIELSSVDTKNSQTLLQLCHFETADQHDEVKEDYANKTGDEQTPEKQKKTEKTRKNFITRNIELAKQRSMAQISLTDEEKLKLESLLSDIDSEEYSVGSLTNDNSEIKLKQSQGELKQNSDSIINEDDERHLNYFKLKREELTNMENLDGQLQEILELYDENDRKIKWSLITINDDEDMLQSADKEGKYWKHYSMQQRLELIDKDLADIAIKDVEEQKVLERKNQQCLEETDKIEEEDNKTESSKEEKA